MPESARPDHVGGPPAESHNQWGVLRPLQRSHTRPRDRIRTLQSACRAGSQRAWRRDFKLVWTVEEPAADLLEKLKSPDQKKRDALVKECRPDPELYDIWHGVRDRLHMTGARRLQGVPEEGGFDSRMAVA